MQVSWDTIQVNAVAMSKKWQDAATEKGQAQVFVVELLRVFGVDEPLQVGTLEYKVQLSGGTTGYIDYLWQSRIAIEMKSRGKDLKSAFAQLENYVEHLSQEEAPELLLVSDFETIKLRLVSTGKERSFMLKDLRKHVRLFACITGLAVGRERDDEIAVNVRAAEKMAVLHDALKASGYDGHDLEVYLTRLLFCMFADDTGIFPKGALLQYVENSKLDGSNLSERLARLFDVLNVPMDVRAKRKLPSDELKRFRYINGGLFEGGLPIADFNSKMRKTLIECMEYDWSTISPAIFGAMFQGVMDKASRREFGAHYTSEENILKLIKPLFLDELREEFERVKADPKGLSAFHERISRLKFLDPACGCGNFLIIGYRELRMLELDILRVRFGKSRQRELDISQLMKVSVEQFYGIEISDYPCQIAQVGMWLMDHLMNMVVSDEFGCYYARLPLAKGATIVCGNALRMDWEDVVPKEELSYIMGNPPYVGASIMTNDQKLDAVSVFGKIRLSNSIDYVGAWFHMAACHMQGTEIRVAFVATNSITQGEQVAPLWRKLFEDYGLHIDFAHRSFRWNNEAKGQAAVFCVIVGFSTAQKGEKRIFYEDGTTIARRINAYLVDAPNLLIESRSKSVCNAPVATKGNQPSDGGHLLLTSDQREELVGREPQAGRLVRQFMGSAEFINGKLRYCLWLNGVPFSEIKCCPSVMRRIEMVRKFRLASTAKATVEKARVPHLFFSITQPESCYLAIPAVSSQRRRYVPIGFLGHDVIAGDALRIVHLAGLYHFGILTSCVHNAWMRAVGGRLKMDYRYSTSAVYNTFPWPDANSKQVSDIERFAKAVLDARQLSQDATLADMYNDTSMHFFPALANAHQNLDRAVLKLYGISKIDTDESEIAAALFELYQKLVGDGRRR